MGDIKTGLTGGFLAVIGAGGAWYAVGRLLLLRQLQAERSGDDKPFPARLSGLLLLVSVLILLGGAYLFISSLFT